MVDRIVLIFGAPETIIDEDWAYSVNGELKKATASFDEAAAQTHTDVIIKHAFMYHFYGFMALCFCCNVPREDNFHSAFLY